MRSLKKVIKAKRKLRRLTKRSGRTKMAVLKKRASITLAKKMEGLVKAEASKVKKSIKKMAGSGKHLKKKLAALGKKAQKDVAKKATKEVITKASRKTKGTKTDKFLTKGFKQVAAMHKQANKFAYI